MHTKQGPRIFPLQSNDEGIAHENAWNIYVGHAQNSMCVEVGFFLRSFVSFCFRWWFVAISAGFSDACSGMQFFVVVIFSLSLFRFFFSLVAFIPLVPSLPTHKVEGPMLCYFCILYCFITTPNKTMCGTRVHVYLCDGKNK